MSTAQVEFKSPVRKVIAMLRQGRDNWKNKYQRVKRTLRSVQHQNRAVEKSREQWRIRAMQAEAGSEYTEPTHE